MKKKYIIYTRVSTQKQISDKGNNSGLGLKAQRESTINYINSVGGVLVGEFKEVQSASNVKDKIKAGQSLSLSNLLRKRPILLEAIEFAKKNNAILLVKEVTRLTRFRLLGEYVLNSGITVVCTDYPNDNALILSIKIALGQEQAEAISINTKAAIKQKGKWSRKPKKESEKYNKVLDGTHAKAAREQKAKYTEQGYKVAISIVCSALKEGNTLLQVAYKLNELGLQTTRGCQFTTTHVIRIRDKYCN